MVSPGLAGLDALARHHWSWISESFLHVSILEEWGERRLSERISDEYSREIPRAFRLIGLMLASNHQIRFSSGVEAAGPSLPHPGGSVQQMAARELSMMRGFDRPLRSIQQEWGKESGSEAAEIVEEAVLSRARYTHWLEDKMAGLDDMSGKLCRNPDDPSWGALNAMLLQLIYGIDETSVHMLLFWHENQTDEAEWSWRRSYGYMLLAFKIARYLASREWAIDFRSGAAVGGVGLPRVGVTSSEVRQIDQDRYISLKSWAGQIAHADQSASDRLQREPAIDALMEQLLARLSELSNPERVSAPNLAGMMERYRYPG